VSTFTEARRAAPAILYWPQVGRLQAEPPQLLWTLATQPPAVYVTYS
jgi:hypothetical protein